MTPSGSSAGRFDPYAILHGLQAARVDYVLIGGLARVIQGSDEVAHGLDLTPSRRPANLQRLDLALGRLGALQGERSIAEDLVTDSRSPLTLRAGAGEIRVVLEPAGARGYEDLRRKASRAALGEGLRPQVAAAGDLVRMLEALGRRGDERRVEMLRRVVELDRGFAIEP